MYGREAARMWWNVTRAPLNKDWRTSNPMVWLCGWVGRYWIGRRINTIESRRGREEGNDRIRRLKRRRDF